MENASMKVLFTFLTLAVASTSGQASCRGSGIGRCTGLFSSRSCSACSNGACFGLLESCQETCNHPGCSCDLDTGVCVSGTGINSIACEGDPEPCEEILSEERCLRATNCDWENDDQPGESPSGSGGGTPNYPPATGTECLDESDLMKSDSYLGYPVKSKTFGVEVTDWWCDAFYFTCLGAGESRKEFASRATCVNLGNDDQCGASPCVHAAVRRYYYYAVSQPGEYGPGNPDGVSGCGVYTSAQVWSEEAIAELGADSPLAQSIADCKARADQIKEDAKKEEDEGGNEKESLSSAFAVILSNLVFLGACMTFLF